MSRPSKYSSPSIPSRGMWRSIGAGKSFLNCLFRDVLRDSDGGGQLPRRGGDGHRQLDCANALTQSLRIGHRTFDSRSGQNLNEFLAAVATKEVSGAEPCLYRLRKCAQYEIAG